MIIVPLLLVCWEELQGGAETCAWHSGSTLSQALASVNISLVSASTSSNFPELQQLSHLCDEDSNFWGSACHCGSKAPRTH